MTSDAKIGLLLGLVFIFIIAFVINGLPRFQNSAETTVQTAEEGFVNADPLGYIIRNSGVLQDQDLEENNNVPILVEHEEEDTAAYTSNSNPWVNEHANIDDSRTGTYYTNDIETNNGYSSLPEDNTISNVNENDETVVALGSEDNVRSTWDLATAVSASREVPLDGSNNRANSRTGERANNPFGGGSGNGFGGGFNRQNSAGAGAGQWNPRGGGFGGMPGAAGNNPNTNNTATTEQSGTTSRDNRATDNTPARDNTTTRENPISRNTPAGFNMSNTPTGNAPAASTGSYSPIANDRRNTPNQGTQQNQTFKEVPYTIQKGDNNLAKIAKRFYGEEEGNRLVNINKIFERNKNVMESPDKIFVGQEIIIPKPAPPVNSNPSSVLSGSMFQNVPTMGGTPARSINSRLDTNNWYTVKEDDSLWKIAAQELGSGSRFEEISKLNTDILTDKNKLKPGMKLRMPAK